MNYENINLEKGMYAVSGKSFSDVLEMAYIPFSRLMFS